MSAQDLADWLERFTLAGGRLQITANGTGVMAQNKLGRNYFSLVGYSDDAVNHLIDTIIPYL